MHTKIVQVETLITQDEFEKLELLRKGLNCTKQEAIRKALLAYYQTCSPNDMFSFNRPYTVIRISQTSRMSPCEWRATLHTGDIMIIHFRFGFLSIAVDGQDIYSGMLDTPTAGLLSLEHLKHHTASFINWKA